MTGDTAAIRNVSAGDAMIAAAVALVGVIVASATLMLLAIAGAVLTLAAIVGAVVLVVWLVGRNDRQKAARAYTQAYAPPTAA